MTDPTDAPPPRRTIGRRAWRWIGADRALLTELVGAWAFTLWAAWPFLRPHRYVTGFDTLAYSGPNLAYTLREWKHHTVPLWNTDLFGGAPHLANTQAGALYPLKLLVAPIDVGRAIPLLVALHLLLLATGLVVLARRRLGLRAPAGLVAAIAVVGSGVVIVKSMQFEQILVIAWAPWLLAAIDAAVRAGRPARPIAATAVVTALVLLAGHPQMMYLLAPLAAGWAVLRALDGGDLRRLWRAGAGAALGALAAAAQLLPTLALAGHTASAGGRTLASVSNPLLSVDPARLLVNLLGDPSEHSPAGIGGGFEAAVILGVCVVALAVLAVVASLATDHGRRRPPADALTLAEAPPAVAGHRWTVLGLAAGALLTLGLALGPRYALYRVAFHALPGLDQARVPSRWVVDLGVAVAVLAAYGVDAIARGAVSAGRSLVALGVIVIGALLIVSGPAPAPRGRLVLEWAVLGGCVLAAGAAARRTPPAGRRAALGAITLVVATELAFPTAHSAARQQLQPRSFTQYGGSVVDALRHSSGRTIAVTGDALDQPAYLVTSLRPNTNALFGIRSIDGYDGSLQLTDRWVAEMGTLSAGPFNVDLTLRSQIRLPLDAARYGRLAVRYAVVDVAIHPAAEAVPGWKGPLITQGSIQLFENPAYTGEASLWFATSVAADAEDAVERLRSNSFAGGSSAIVERGGPSLACTSACAPVAAASVRRPSSGGNGGRVIVTAATDRPAVLRVDEQFDAGWRATVDGHHAKVFAVDGFDVGVALGTGNHTVELTYVAPGWRLGVALTIVALATIVVLALDPRRLRLLG